MENVENIGIDVEAVKKMEENEKELYSNLAKDYCDAIGALINERDTLEHENDAAYYVEKVINNIIETDINKFNETQKWDLHYVIDAYNEEAIGYPIDIEIADNFINVIDNIQIFTKEDPEATKNIENLIREENQRRAEDFEKKYEIGVETNKTYENNQFAKYSIFDMEKFEKHISNLANEIKENGVAKSEVFGNLNKDNLKDMLKEYTKSITETKNILEDKFPKHNFQKKLQDIYKIQGKVSGILNEKTQDKSQTHKMEKSATKSIGRQF